MALADCQKVGRDINLTAVIERYDVVDGSGSREGGVNQAMQVLKARISLASSGQHVAYTLRVTFDRNAWTLNKRFSEVAALHESLRRYLQSLPELPAKSAVRQFSPEYLEARKVALNEYLQELCKRRDVLNCPESQQFFGLPAHLQAFRQPHESEPTQVAEVQEANFGISAFTYDAAQGLLLLGATDKSWASRMDTKITNIKLPWEPSAPNLPSSQMSLWKQSPADLRYNLLFTCRYTASISSCALLSTGRDTGLCLCGLSDGTVGCHDISGPGTGSATGSTLPLLRHTAAVSALAVDDAEQWVISASKDSAIKVFETKRRLIQCEVQAGAPATVMYYCQTQKRLFSGLQTGRVIVWDTSILPIQQLATIPDGAGDPVMSTKVLAFDYDAASSTLFTAASSALTLWAVRSSNLGLWGRKTGQILGVSTKPTAVAWASSSRELLVGFSSGALVIFDVDSSASSFAIQAHRDEVTCMRWLDAPRRLLTASADKTLKIWDFPSLRRTPLEEQVGFTGLAAPIVSMSSASAGRAQVPEASQSRPNPVSFPSASSANPVSSVGGEGRGFDPLSGRFVAQGGYPGAGTVSPPMPTDSRAGTSAGESAVPDTAQPRVAGAKPGALVRGDSNDDLAGWDS